MIVALAPLSRHVLGIIAHATGPDFVNTLHPEDWTAFFDRTLLLVDSEGAQLSYVHEITVRALSPSNARSCASLRSGRYRLCSGLETDSRD